MNTTYKSPAMTKYLCLLFFISLTFISGCNQSLALKVETEVPVPLIDKIPIAMGVHYDDKFRNYTYQEDTAERPKWAIESGPSQVALFDQVLPSMFEEVRQIEALPATGAVSGVQAVLIPSIEEMQFSLPQETRLDMYEVWIKYKIRLMEANGNLITEWPLTAYGKTETEFMKNREQGLNGAMELALRDAGAKLAIGFPEVTEIRDWLAVHTANCTGEVGKTC